MVGILRKCRWGIWKRLCGSIDVVCVEDHECGLNVEVWVKFLPSSLFSGLVSLALCHGGSYGGGRANLHLVIGLHSRGGSDARAALSSGVYGRGAHGGGVAAHSGAGVGRETSARSTTGSVAAIFFSLLSTASGTSRNIPSSLRGRFGCGLRDISFAQARLGHQKRGLLAAGAAVCSRQTRRPRARRHTATRMDAISCGWDLT